MQKPLPFARREFACRPVARGLQELLDTAAHGAVIEVSGTFGTELAARGATRAWRARWARTLQMTRGSRMKARTHMTSSHSLVLESTEG